VVESQSQSFSFGLSLDKQSSLGPRERFAARSGLRSITMPAEARYERHREGRETNSSAVASTLASALALRIQFRPRRRS
jgi:hypothetical protein